VLLSIIYVIVRWLLGAVVVSLGRQAKSKMIDLSTTKLPPWSGEAEKRRRSRHPEIDKAVCRP
jgi:hypothetical protein